MRHWLAHTLWRLRGRPGNFYRDFRIDGYAGQRSIAHEVASISTRPPKPKRLRLQGVHEVGNRGGSAPSGNTFGDPALRDKQESA